VFQQPCPSNTVVDAVKISLHLRTVLPPALQWTLDAPLEHVMSEAAAIRDASTESHITFSPKVFLPMTRLCRNSCGYCTFAQPPREGQRIYMLPEEVLQTALAGQEAGCTEALITVGDKPELRYPEAAEQLRELGFETTVEYIQHLCAMLLQHTELLPHINAGVISSAELAAFRTVSASQGLMLESTAPALLEPGGAHHNCPDKDPKARWRVLHAAGAPRNCLRISCGNGERAAWL
jgi:FO synthase